MLIKLADTRMPFGTYAGHLLVDRPEPYVVWFKGKGFPAGEVVVGLPFSNSNRRKSNPQHELYLSARRRQGR